MGPQSSFERAINLASGGIIFLSDQDDIWHPEKLKYQVGEITSLEPTLVISRRDLVDKSNIRLKKQKIPVIRPSFNNALVENIAYGNTQLLNPHLREILIKHEGEAKYFDAWVYLVAAAYGEVKLVDYPLVDYRIHDSNSIGLGSKRLSHLRSIIVDFRDQGLSFRETNTGVSQEKHLVLLEFERIFSEKSLLKRYLWAFRCKIYRKTRIETFLWKITAPIIGSSRHSSLKT
jgi:glycosyltransferase involved in cell wall biosynthesis